MVLLVAMPLLQLVIITMSDDGRKAWYAVLVGDASANLFWEPFSNTLIIGILAAVGSVLLGSFMAWLVTLTDVPAWRVLGFMSIIPFSFPPYSVAMVWESLFRNSRMGGYVGLISKLGIDVPDWIAWGVLPISLTLVAQLFSLVFLLVSAALASINSEIIEAAELTGASRTRILHGIILPVVSPAIISSTLLVFAQGVSSFAPPAILGIPVRFYTLSTRLQSAFRTGQEERAYVLALLLVGINALVLAMGSRITMGRSFAVFTGKGGRKVRQRLGLWRWPMLVIGGIFCGVTTILPPLVLLITSLTRSGSLDGNFTLRYWTGQPDELSHGIVGILRNPDVLKATINTLVLALTVSLFTIVLGLLVGYVTIRGKNKLVKNVVDYLSFFPLLIPSIAFGTIYIVQFSRPLGPIPALYGTLVLLVIAGVAHTVPFAAQSGKAAMSQVADELEEAAKLTGAGFILSITHIIIPLTARSLLASSVLVFTTMTRELSLVLLLATPGVSTLSIIAYEYLSYNGGALPQFAYAITLIVVIVSSVATLLAYNLHTSLQLWLER